MSNVEPVQVTVTSDDKEIASDLILLLSYRYDRLRFSVDVDFCIPSSPEEVIRTNGRTTQQNLGKKTVVKIVNRNHDAKGHQMALSYLVNIAKNIQAEGQYQFILEST